VDLWSSWDKALYTPGLVDDRVQSFALRGALSLRRLWQQAKQTEGFCRKFSFKVICSMISPYEQR